MQMYCHSALRIKAISKVLWSDLTFTFLKNLLKICKTFGEQRNICNICLMLTYQIRLIFFHTIKNQEITEQRYCVRRDPMNSLNPTLCLKLGHL